MKNFLWIKICLYLPFKYWNTFNNAMFKWFWTIFSLGAPESFIVSFSKLVETLIFNANTANIKLFGPEKLSGLSRNRPQLCNAYLNWSIYVNRPQQILDNRVNKNTGGAKFTLLSKLRTWSTLNLDTKIAFAVIWFYYRIFLWLLTSYLNMHVLAILNL